MTGLRGKPRVLVFIVAYNAEKTIRRVVERIPPQLLADYEADVLIIDDCSKDLTFARSLEISNDPSIPFRVTALFNPVNQGYGGNQKLGYRYAIEHGYDFVALVHGDGQYAPECLPQLLALLRDGQADAVFGSRMITPSGALKGGMPVYKFVGNKILTWIENRLLRSHLSEFHSGFRLYSTRALRAIPFERNSDDFHFDTEIIIQLLVAKLDIEELPIPTFYGEEVCHVNGMKYAGNVVKAALWARLQRAGLLYDRKFDCAPPDAALHRPKLAYLSPHSLTLARVRAGSRVLDIGCAFSHMAEPLAERRRCVVDGIDSQVPAEAPLRAFYLCDLNSELPAIDYSQYDYIVILDRIEHLAEPELFLDRLRLALSSNPKIEVIATTANIGFVITRLMLLIGQFNYCRRGVLDLTHTRLFTFRSFERILTQSGYDILERKGIPGPMPLALGDNLLSRFLLNVNRALIHVSRGMFSYQIFLRVKPRPTLETSLRNTREHSRQRAELIEGSRG